MAKLLALCGLLLLSALSVVSGQTCSLPGELREDCGYVGITQGQCEAKGCCWSPTSGGSNFPWCFFPEVVDCGEYSATDVKQTPTGIVATLELVNEGCEYYGQDLPLLTLQVDYETDDRLHVKIFDAQKPRYEVPESVFPRPAATQSHEKTSNFRFGFVSKPFGFYVSRADTGDILFNSSASGNNPQFKNIVFEDQYLEISNQLPSGANIYGLGEHIRPMRLDEGLTYTLWNADEPTPVNQNLYGAHPFYMELRNGKAHGVLLLNSNGMDIDFKPGVLTYKAIGGVFDFYFFTGPTPAKVVDQYTQLVGRPYFFPYWAFGFHQCKYGYKNLDEVKGVVKGYADARIPMDTMWIDIDYMEQYKDWTFDPVNYPAAEVKKFVDDLHAKNQRNVLIVDPGIKNLTGYKYYDVGLQQDIFIKSAATGKPALGMVWPYYTVFPDFLNPKTQAYWTDSIKDFLQIVSVDGLWIDMNEVASFCYGENLATCQYPVPFEPKDGEKEEEATTEAALPKSGKRAFDPNNPPYKINNANDRSPLERKTMAMDAYHYGGYLEYDVHNIYGLAEGIMTTKGLEEVTGKRAFVLSRSTFPGSGKNVGHWTGDNYSTWDHLYYAIAGMLNFQIFGVPFAGADICGFIKDTTEELCARWIEVGAFYPFSRNHNTLGAAPQELYLWDSVAEISRNVLGIRYSLLSLYYTLMYEAHTAGATIVRPLFFEFPSDPEVPANDRQFLVGSSILVSPVLEEGATAVTAYFPKARWYDFYTFEQFSSSGQYLTLEAPLDFIPLHIRGGSVITFQYPALTTADTRKNNFYLVAALDDASAATGTFYNDDGESMNLANSTYITYTLTSTSTSGSLTSAGSFRYTTPTNIDKVTILGLKFTPKKVVLNGATITSFQFSSGNLVVSSSISLNRVFTLQWSA